MNSDKIASIIMTVLFLSSILASSGCLEDTDDEIGYEDNNYTWSIVDSTLTVSDKNGEVFARYEITSLSNEEFVFVDPDYPKIKTTLTR